jgi:hypothetical protein
MCALAREEQPPVSRALVDASSGVALAREAENPPKQTRTTPTM